jgi:hypothetical protein
MDGVDPRDLGLILERYIYRYSMETSNEAADSCYESFLTS